jgi:hypothetical protein
MKAKEVPVLTGWVSLPVAAKRLRVKRQRLFQMGVEENKLGSLRQVPGGAERPAAYVISEAELCRLLREQLEGAIRVAQRDDSDEGRTGLANLERQLDAVQLDAVQLLSVQLGAAADAADVAGDEALARLLRKRAESVKAPAPVAA